MRQRTGFAAAIRGGVVAGAGLLFGVGAGAATLEIRVNSDGTVLGEFPPQTLSRDEIATAIGKQFCDSGDVAWIVLFERKKATRFRAVCNGELRFKRGNYKLVVDP